MTTTGRISRIENIPGVATKIMDIGPLSASGDTPVDNANIFILGFAHRDLIIDDVLYSLEVGADDATATISYVTLSDWEGDVAGVVSDGSPPHDTEGSWTSTGITMALDTDFNDDTARALRSDGDAPVIPAGSWFGLDFDGTLTNLARLQISMRCREIS
jgi:hypothetical protein